MSTKKIMFKLLCKMEDAYSLHEVSFKYSDVKRLSNTQSSAPEDGQNNFPKHVELTGIINKPLLLHLVGCLYYLYQ